MIALDTNLLVYANRRDLEWHSTAVDVVNRALEGSEPVGLCWPVVHEFIAVVSNPRLFADPTPLDRSLAHVEHWMSSPVVTPLRETASHLATLRRLTVRGRVSGGAVHDARIAAICLDNGVRELWTADRDFTRFPDLAVRNPLITSSGQLDDEGST